MIEFDHQVVRTPRVEYRAPSVIRLQHMVAARVPRAKLSRREVFSRDRHTCQYCGRQSHYSPSTTSCRATAAPVSTWENLVTAWKDLQPPQGRQDAR